jgi:Ca-activated chloride channel homolog
MLLPGSLFQIVLVSWLMRFLIAILVFVPFLSIAQITSAQQKALNAYAEYANQSAEEITQIVSSVIDYYPKIERKNSMSPRYVCPFQMDDYYFTNVGSLKKSLSSAISAPVEQSFKNLRDAEGKIDQYCKALDTYHKLEDYKQDNFTKAIALVEELHSSLVAYKNNQQKLQSTLESAYKKLAGTPSGAYRQADTKMLSIIETERKYIDSWKFNLRDDIHTGWDVGKLEQSISDTYKNVKALQGAGTTLKYPASSMWDQFPEALNSVLEVKRKALDQYNFEAKKSDRYTNEVYLELINYFNGVLVSNYNTFIQFSERDGYYGLKTLKYISSFEIRTQTEAIDISVKPFKDIPRSPLKIITEKNPLSKSTYEAFSNYVTFINETWRQTDHLQSVLSNFGSSASYFRDLENYDKRAPLHFDYSDFHLPLSDYQKTITESSRLLPDHAKSLNEQTEVLLNILKEMDELAASIDVEVRQRKYEHDRLKNIYTILEREAELFRIWDDKKEILYNDVRSLYDSYPPSNKTNSWEVSGKALRELTDLDREGLFKARAYYRGDSAITISTEKTDASLREVISKEYDNMKGIQKIGRNNGLCPYTPYEDLPETSKKLSELFKKLKPAVGNSSRYNHPYHSMVYLYNNAVDEYNKFCELSTSVFHLQTVKQPELFVLKSSSTTASVKKEPDVVQHSTIEKEKSNTVVTDSKDIRKNTIPVSPEKNMTIRDTIYIEKRDTVYLPGSPEDSRSMEGYAINNMILLLDVSGSMNQPDKLPLLKKSVIDMLSMMRAEDKITVITFSGKPKVLLKAASFKEEEKIKNAINDLTSSGKTDGNAAMKLAYKVADENYLRGGNNRIILATDGEFALNEDAQSLIEKFSGEDIFLSVFNFGKGAGSSKVLQNMALMGKGNYEAISKENIDLKLIREVKAKRKK